MPADPYTVAELDAAVARVDDLTDMTTDHYLTVEEEVRAALTAAAPLIAARVRAEAAADIRVHADQHAPAGHPLNHPRTVLRRHLLLAARIAEGPLTDADVADIAAQVVAQPHATTEEDHHAA